jgi:hypothetical protein
MLKTYNRRPFKQAPINSVFIVFENKINRDKCLEAFKTAEKDKPIVIKVCNFFCWLLGMDYNKFDYGKHRDSDTHNKVFWKKYVPFVVTPAPKPEFIIWQNLDFVNKPIGSKNKCKHFACSALVKVLLLVLACVYPWAIMTYVHPGRRESTADQSDKCNYYSLFEDILGDQQLT